MAPPPCSTISLLTLPCLGGGGEGLGQIRMRIPCGEGVGVAQVLLGISERHGEIKIQERIRDESNMEPRYYYLSQPLCPDGWTCWKRLVTVYCDIDFAREYIVNY